MKKKALITGITGQDGSYLTEFLYNKGYEVYGIVRRSSCRNTIRIDHLLEDKYIEVFHGDLTDSSSVDNIIHKIKPTELYNLGAQSHVAVSFEAPEFTAETDALGTLRVLESVRKHVPTAKVYQASTSEMFGGIQSNMLKKGFNEDSPFYPKSPYGSAKLYAYWITKNYRESYDLFAVNGILFNHESPRRSENFVSRKITYWIGLWLKAQKENRKIRPLNLGNLNAKRDWGHAKDYVRAMWMMLQQDQPKDYVVATGCVHTVRDFVNKAFDIIGKKIRWVGRDLNEVAICDGQIVVTVNEKFYRPNEVKCLLGDSSLIRQELGWQQEYTFEDLVYDMIKFDCSSVGINI